jgi:hypothetical protein
LTDTPSPPDARPPHAPPLVERHWAEIVLSVFAIVIAGISLWIAIDTENTNRQLVSEAAWPILQTYHSAHGPDGQPALSLNIVNAGVGPAKIETLEVFWNGQAYRGAQDLLKACCGFSGLGGLTQSGGPVEGPYDLSTSQAAGRVLRAGDFTQMVIYALTASNEAVYKRFGAARDKITYRVCYCSVFNECWLSDGRNLNPPRVKMCPLPDVPYSE